MLEFDQLLRWYDRHAFSLQVARFFVLVVSDEDLPEVIYFQPLFAAWISLVISDNCASRSKISNDSHTFVTL